jgi:TRAP-type C4-dicarboxylate transport system substrate-binding protein
MFAAMPHRLSRRSAVAALSAAPLTLALHANALAQEDRRDRDGDRDRDRDRFLQFELDAFAKPTFDLDEFERRIAENVFDVRVNAFTYRGDGILDIVDPLRRQSDLMALGQADELEHHSRSLPALRLPYVFGVDPDPRALAGFVASPPIERRIRSEMSGRNVYLLALWFDGFRTLTSRVPIAAPSDLRGLKVGVVAGDDDVARATFESLGATTVLVPRAHRFDRLSDGTIDVVEDTLESISGGKYYREFAHVALTYHAVQVAGVAISPGSYYAMRADTQAGLYDAVRFASAGALERRFARDDRIVRELNTAGVSVTVPPRAAFAKATASVARDFAPARFDKNFLDDLVA